MLSHMHFKHPGTDELISCDPDPNLKEKAVLAIEALLQSRRSQNNAFVRRTPSDHENSFAVLSILT
jgi:hypothetical protein